MDTKTMKKIKVYAVHTIKSRMLREVAVHLTTSYLLSKVAGAKSTGGAIVLGLASFAIGSTINSMINDSDAVKQFDAHTDWEFYVKLHQIEIAR